jgi:hypothetical protein
MGSYEESVNRLNEYTNIQQNQGLQYWATGMFMWIKSLEDQMGLNGTGGSEESLRISVPC